MREAIELWDAGDYEGVLEFIHPDVVWHLDPIFPDLDKVYEGHEGMRRFFKAYIEPWEKITLELEEVIDDRPGQLYVAVRNRAVGRQGLEVDLAIHQVYRLDEDRLLTEFFAFGDPADARREAGLADE